MSNPTNSEPPAGHRLISPERIDGWLVLYGPAFAAPFIELAEGVERLRQSLSEEEYRRHPTVKLFAAVFRVVRTIVPSNPNLPDYRLSGDLSVFRRLKDHGLPERFRLFWVFSEQHKTIIFLYLNDRFTLRKAGARSDVYAVFQRLVIRGEIGASFEENYRIWLAANPELAPTIPQPSKDQPGLVAQSPTQRPTRSKSRRRNRRRRT